jgi:hypothetical protein
MPINMPGYRPATMDAVAKALDIAQNVFGIGTEGAKQRLMNAQTAGETQKTDAAKASASELQKWMSRGTDSAPGGGPGPRRGAITQEDLSNPLLAPQLKPMLDAQKDAQGIQHARNDETRKARGEVSGIQNEFANQAGVKEAQGDIEAAREVSKYLLSGNPAATKGGQKRLGLLLLGVNRLGPEVAGVAENEGILAKFKDAVSKGATGFSTPEDIAAAHQAAKLVFGNARNTLDSVASRYAAQKAPLFGEAPDAFKQKNLLPAGFGEDLPDVRVMKGKKTGQPTIHYLDKKTNAFLPVHMQKE